MDVDSEFVGFHSGADETFRGTGFTFLNQIVEHGAEPFWVGGRAAYLADFAHCNFRLYTRCPALEVHADRHRAECVVAAVVGVLPIEEFA